MAYKLIYKKIFIKLQENKVEELKLEDNQIKTQDPEDTILDPTQTSIHCEYVDKLFETTQKSAESHDIQDIIGYQNNKVGIYIYAEIEDFPKMASELVNSNGGDWGYVLIPYNVKDYNSDRWNKLFGNLKKYHLIPIIQLWDIDLNDEKQTDEQIKKSVEFLNTLDWPIKNRYISAYNEPNDKKFWKGNIDPEGYAKILNKTINRFKETNSNFFIMNGAFNASARTSWDYLDEQEYLNRMERSVPGILSKLDGWASHPYPQPNFTGSPKDKGRDSIRAYEWELLILKKHGVDVDKLPIFITETGWPHKEGDQDNPKYLNKYQVADNIKEAYEKVWLKDDRIVAVTPFTIKYEPPHDNWSWITQNNNPYPQFDSVKSIEKEKGIPPEIVYYKSKVWVCKEQ